MKRFFLAITVLTAFFVIFISCKKDDNNNPKPILDNIPSELLQTWKEVAVNGKQIVTDSTTILQIQNSETAYLMERVMYDTVPVWQTMTSTVSYDNDTLKINGSIDNPFTRVVLTYKIIELTSNSLKMKLLSKVVNGNYSPDNTIGQESAFEVALTGRDALVEGMWKSVPTSEADPFGLYFRTANSYDYYYYNAQGAPSIKNDNEGYYWFYGSFIILRYKNTPNTHDQKEYVECWNVKIIETTDVLNPKTMTFNSLQEDGKVETCSFKYLGVQ